MKGIIEVDIGDLLDHDLAQFLDDIAERLTGSSALKNIDYKVVGVCGNGITLLLEVTGDASEIVSLDEDDEEGKRGAWLFLERTSVRVCY